MGGQGLPQRHPLTVPAAITNMCQACGNCWRPTSQLCTKRKRKHKRREYALWRQCNEKPSVTMGCPGPALHTCWMVRHAGMRRCPCRRRAVRYVMTLALSTVTGQLADRYQSYAGLPCDDDVVQPAVISLHAVVILVGDDVVGQGHSGKALPHSLEAGYLLLGGLLVPIPLQGHPLQGHCLLHAPATHLLLPTAFTHTHTCSDTVAHHTCWLHHPKTMVAW